MSAGANVHARAYMVDDNQLVDVERFCLKNNLHQIAAICTELRFLRAEYILLSARIDKLTVVQNATAAIKRDAFAADMATITDGVTDDAKTSA